MGKILGFLIDTDIIKNFIKEFNEVLGSDFLTKYNAVIDYEKFALSVYDHNIDTTVPLESKCNAVSVVPPRCEVIRYFKVETIKESVTVTYKITEGVYAAGSIVKPRSRMITVVRIWNTNNNGDNRM